MTVSPSSESQSKVRHMDALPVGTRLAEFEILSLIGVGGFGMVYKAFDHSLHRAVAIKEYMPATLVARAEDGALWARSSTDEPAFQAGLSSFVDEARMLAQFDHPSLVKVFRFWESHNTAYMVMPLYKGMTFKQARLQMRAPPPEAWLRQVLWSVLDALRVLHGANTLHRDISPDNIFLQDVGPPVLLDLGASRHAINDRDRKHTAVLKVNYAPIEQYSDGEGEGETDLAQGPWSDLYSLGAVVHGCLCNDAPLPATLRALRDRMVPFNRVARTVHKQFGQKYSAPFVAAISQALKLQPESRPQSIDDFLALMAMESAPTGLEHFDFRAELGDIWVEPTDQPDASVSATTVDLTGQPPLSAPSGGRSVSAPAPQKIAEAVVVAAPPVPMEDIDHDDSPDTVFLERDSVLREPESVQVARPAAAAHAASVRSTAPQSDSNRDKEGVPVRRPLWLWAGVGVLLIAGFAAFWALGTSPEAMLAKEPASDPIITELKQQPVPEAPQAAPLEAESTEPQVATAEPEPVAGPAPAFVGSDDPRAVSKNVPRSARAPKTPGEQPLPAAYPIQQPEPPPPPSEPAPTPRRVVPPPPLCADTNVFTRSMCLRVECAKPGNAPRAACVEFRRNFEPLENKNFAN